MIRVAVIGTGYWGKNLVRVFNRTRSAVLFACCDADTASLELIQRQYPDIRSFTSVDDLLQDNAVDAIAVAVPSPKHYEVAKKVLLAGKHVYVEKPITLRSDHAKELVDLARAQDRRLMVGHLLLYHPGIRMIKDMIAGGDLGDIYYVYAQRLNLGIVRKNENAWWSLAPHDISVILYLLGQNPSVVSARGEGYLRKETQDVVFANLHFLGGRMGQVHVSWLDPHKMRKITIVGSRKMLVFDDMQATEKIKIYDKGAEMPPDYVSYDEAVTLRHGDIHIPNVNMEEPLKVECRHFVDCILNNENPLSDGINGLNVVRVLEAGQCSLETHGTPVEIESC